MRFERERQKIQKERKGRILKEKGYRKREIEDTIRENIEREDVKVEERKREYKNRKYLQGDEKET